MAFIIEETKELLEGKTVKEFFLEFYDTENYKDLDPIKGEGPEIPWEEFPFNEYDDSFGLAAVSGWISFTDGTWLEREEYDGSEWWEERIFPSLKNEE